MTKQTPAKLTFDDALKKFVGSTATSKDMALLCSQMAITHFKEHGDVTYCQRFHDAMPQNYLRRAAFIMWLVAHAPIAMENQKFKKDVSENAIDFDIEGAMNKPFWDFKPEKPIVNYGSDDIWLQLERQISRFEKTDKMQPADKDAVLALAEAKAAIAAAKKAHKRPAANDEEGEDETTDESVVAA